ncbi:MAG: nucleoside hydrolase [Sphaerochaetaceae bacterium]|jgi:ribosylpyrimidine nucleosidase
MAEKIILDVDTGHDDMVAIVMASGLEEIDLLGVVAVAGNQVLEKTLHNTLNVCQLIGEKAPVFAGMDRPIIRERVVAGDIHGKSGLDGPTFPPLTKQAERLHGVNFIVDTVMGNPHEVTLVPTGPLSDIAMAIRLEPRLPKVVKQIVLMGGSLGAGNRTPYAEFNIFADGEAASIVFNSGAPIVMMGLDVTLQVLLDRERLDRYSRFSSKTATMFNASMKHYMAACRLHGAEYPAMHDPCCVAYVADPTIFTTEEHSIEVELKDEERYGKTIALPPTPNKPTLVGMGADTSLFWPLLERAFSNLP